MQLQLASIQKPLKSNCAEVRLPFSCFVYTKPPEHNSAEVSIHTKTIRMQLCGGPLSLPKIRRSVLASDTGLAAIISGLLDLPSRSIAATLSVSKPPLPYKGTLSPRGLCCTPDVSAWFTSSPSHVYNLQALPYKTYHLYPRLQEVVVCSPGERLATEAPPRKVPGAHLGASTPQSLPRSSRDLLAGSPELTRGKQTPQSVRL